MRYGANTENGHKNIPGKTMGNRTPLVRAFPGCEVIFRKGYHEVGGFVGFPNGKWVYFNSSDDRGAVNYLVRTASGPKDYTGGSNHFTKGNSKDDLIALIRQLSEVPHMPPR